MGLGLRFALGRLFPVWERGWVSGGRGGGGGKRTFCKISSGFSCPTASTSK